MAKYATGERNARSVLTDEHRQALIALKKANPAIDAPTAKAVLNIQDLVGDGAIRRVWRIAGLSNKSLKESLLGKVAGE